MQKVNKMAGHGRMCLRSGARKSTWRERSQILRKVNANASVSPLVYFHFIWEMSIPTVALPAPLSFPSWRGVDFRILGATLTFWPPKPICDHAGAGGGRGCSPQQASPRNAIQHQLDCARHGKLPRIPRATPKRHVATHWSRKRRRALRAEIISQIAANAPRAL